jgi:hypothetical protein
MSETATIVHSQTNPRSTSGLVALGPANEQTLVHFKRCKHEFQFRAEVVELERVATLLGDAVGGISAVELCSIDAAQNTLYTKHVASKRTLFDLVWEQSTWRGLWRRPSPGLHEIGERVGRWLKIYHSTTTVLASEYVDQVTWIVDSTNRKLKAIVESNRVMVPQRLEQSIRQYLDRVATDFHAWGPQSVSRIHGDLDLANILIAPDGKLVLVDFADSRVGFAVEDVVRFWHSVRTIAAVSRRNGAMIASAADAVLDAYGIPRGVLNSPLVKLLRCWNSIAFLLTTIQLRSRWGFGTRRMFDRLAAAHTGWLERNLEQR